MSKPCDIAQNAKNQVRAAIIEEEAAVRQTIEEEIELYEKPLIQGRIDKLLSKFGRGEITEDEFNKHYGGVAERKKLADKLFIVMHGNPHLTDTMIREFKYRIANAGAEFAAGVIEANELGQSRIVLDKLPISTLKSFYKFAEDWTLANGSNFSSIYYRWIRFPFGLPKSIRFQENTGAYNKVFLATQRYADAQAWHIHNFMEPEIFDDPDNPKKKKRDYGMSQVLQRVENLFTDLTQAEQDLWLKGGFLKDRNVSKAQSNLIEIFTWMMHGRIKNVTQQDINDMKTTDKAKKKTQGTAYKEPGLYIFTQWAPTKNRYNSTGDAIYTWQRPIPFKYDPKNPPKIPKDFREKKRYDTIKLLKNSVPLTEDMISKLEGLAKDARIIDNEYFEYSKKKTEESFKRILNALVQKFPDKTIGQLQNAFVNYDFTNKAGDNIWSKEEMARFNYMEENFTKYSLAAPFLYEGVSLEYKEQHFPYMFDADMYKVLLGETMDNIAGELEDMQEPYDKATGEEKAELLLRMDGLEASLRHMRDLKKELLFAPEDGQMGSQMVARQNSKYFKHISNAFDMLKSRTDKNVYKDFLEHGALAIERNNLTAELIGALDMTDQGPVKEAMIELYKRTIGRRDTRSNLFGIDISDDRLPDSTVRALRLVRKFTNLMISGPKTAITNAYGNIEKANKAGVNNLRESWDYLKKIETDPENHKKLMQLIQESGVAIFEEFFTHKIVDSLEEQNVNREDIGSIVAAMLQYWKEVAPGSNISEVKAEANLQKLLKTYFGKAMKGDALMTKKEAEAMTVNMKRDRRDRWANEIVNFSIMNKYTMRNKVKTLPTRFFRPSFWADRVLVPGRALLGKAAVMSEMEKHLRITSFLLGVKGAQKAGIIKEGDVHDLTGHDRKLAIEYGRMATNLMFDFGMSKQHVGEIHSGALGQFLSQFTTWRIQKFSSDLHLFKYAAGVFNTNSTPIAVVKAILKASNPKNSDSLLRKTDNDAMMLRRYLRGQFLIEALSQVLFIGTAGIPYVGSVGRIFGMRKLGPAGSDLAALFWMPVMLVLQGALLGGWEDEEEVERTMMYALRKIPGVGVGVGLGFDLMALFASWGLENEELMEKKATDILNYVAPVPYTRPLKKALTKGAADLVD